MAEWPSVPPEAVSWMLPELDSIADEMTAAILREVPGYGRPDDDTYPRVVHRVARDAVHQFAARIADPAAPWEPTARMFHDIGRIEAAEGRGLDALHAALRVGARVTWQRLREKARQGSGDAEVFARIGEVIFRYLDELAAACSAGYAEAKAEFAGETERLKARLLDLLVADPPAPAAAISSLARTVGWRLPRRVAVVALTERAGGVPGPLPPLPADVLAGLSGREPCLLVPDPDGPGRLRLLKAGLRSWPERWLSPSAGWPAAWTGSSAAMSIWLRSFCSPTQNSPARSPARCSPRCASCGPSRPTGWRRPCSPGWKARTTPGPRRAACTFTRRLSDTGFGGSPSCSATGSAIQTRVSPSRSRCGFASSPAFRGQRDLLADPAGPGYPAVVPGAELAVITHAGSHVDVDRAHGALAAYVTSHALKVDHPIREYYLVGRHDTADENAWRTEIGWPIFSTGAAA